MRSAFSENTAAIRRSNSYSKQIGVIQPMMGSEGVHRLQHSSNVFSMLDDRLSLSYSC